jgi:CO/xanthine dehydrogenase FAD-binding subunit
MKPAAFEYFRPGTLDEAVELLKRYDPEAKILAGGQSLVPLMNFRLAQPRFLIDTNRIRDLSYIREGEGAVAVGALTRHADVEGSPLIEEKCPLMTEAVRCIGHRTIRNRATVGGSVAHADPSSEIPCVLTALDGEVTVRGPGGERVIGASELFVTLFTTSLASNEIIAEVRLPKLPSGTGWAWEELSRRSGDYAIVGAAVTLALDGDGRCESVRIALAGVGLTPIRCREAEDALRGQAVDNATIRETAERCAEATDPNDDIHASADYKKAMVIVFVERALRRALDRTGG